MLIGLIADTHIREMGLTLHEKVGEAFKGVDLILHAGDIYIPEVLDELEHIAPVIAVSGDDDYGAVLTDKRVKTVQEITLEGKKLWLVHESPQYHALKLRRKVVTEFSGSTPEIVVFGHTHYSIMERLNETLFVNPGSPTDGNKGSGTVALMNISSAGTQVEILRL